MKTHHKHVKDWIGTGVFCLCLASAGCGSETNTTAPSNPSDASADPEAPDSPIAPQEPQAQLPDGIPGGVTAIGETFENGIGMVLAYIPAGTFQMGSPEDEEGREDYEAQHEVTLSEMFLIGTTEVTQGQWHAVMGNNPAAYRDSDNSPVNRVNWNDAMAFCERLTNSEREAGRLHEDWIYTLPTEAQWEYACRAGTTTPYHTGNTISIEQGNIRTDDLFAPGTRVGTRDVAMHPLHPNPWGLYDMHGNVSEWCLDPYFDYPSSAVTDPVNPSEESYDAYRVLRGGDWLTNPNRCRSAERGWSPLIVSSTEIGLRVVLVPRTTQAP